MNPGQIKRSELRGAEPLLGSNQSRPGQALLAKLLAAAASLSLSLCEVEKESEAPIVAKLLAAADPRDSEEMSNCSASQLDCFTVEN